MADNWMDERDWRERERRRRERYGRTERDEYGPYNYGGGYREGRSFESPGERDNQTDVFGERQTGADYGPARYGGYSGDPRRYERQAARDYQSGGRYYGDDGRERVYPETYGQGARPYGDVRSSDRRGSYRSDDYDRHSNFGFGFWPEDRHSPEPREERRGFLNRVASWFSGEPGDPRRGEHSHRGRGPKGYRRSDERIREDAHDRLTDDHWLDASEIEVNVNSGEVILGGTVYDREAKHRAERLVESISGVTHVQNNLRIGQPVGLQASKGGNPLTTAGPGFGDSVLEAQARGEQPGKHDRN